VVVAIDAQEQKPPSAPHPISRGAAEKLAYVVPGIESLLMEKILAHLCLICT